MGFPSLLFGVSRLCLSKNLALAGFFAFWGGVLVGAVQSASFSLHGERLRTCRLKPALLRAVRRTGVQASACTASGMSTDHDQIRDRDRVPVASLAVETPPERRDPGDDLSHSRRETHRPTPELVGWARPPTAPALL